MSLAKLTHTVNVDTFQPSRPASQVTGVVLPIQTLPTQA